jgi:hypothetical protein
MSDIMLRNHFSLKHRFAINKSNYEKNKNRYSMRDQLFEPRVLHINAVIEADKIMLFYTKIPYALAFIFVKTGFRLQPGFSCIIFISCYKLVGIPGHESLYNYHWLGAGYSL